MKSLRLAAMVVALAFPFTGSVLAKEAICFTSDDGRYPCNFTPLFKDGSFEISAATKPTYRLIMQEKNVANGYGDFGTGRRIFLPGEYIRSSADSACWENTETNTKICAW
ncbi:hypothetical protein E1162_18535 [Rhodobacteraceae bacterium RKSG542]|uniref:hypothetical protein n=1 Tax=Pseudovibrio flavus TaxID=2529854 RepID=UPI0012BBF5F2|nr:hypothetical protein [Pseudovibrio flavus]MTI19243.1 hypothetical protein [Pseudovibrio flavus]